jgi:kynureninase
MPQRVGDKIARLIGADAGEVVVVESTSINLFKVLATSALEQLTRGYRSPPLAFAGSAQWQNLFALS